MPQWLADTVNSSPLLTTSTYSDLGDDIPPLGTMAAVTGFEFTLERGGLDGSTLSNEQMAE